MLNQHEEGGEHRFGETAVRLGYIDNGDLKELLQKQAQTRRPIGEILVELGVLTRAQMEAELDNYAGATRQTGT